MSTLAPSADTGTTRYDFIIDDLLDERLGMFRQVTVHDEIGLDVGSGVIRFTFRNWNTSNFSPIIERNGTVLTETTDYTVDATNGTITLVTAMRDGEEILGTYNFAYVTNDMLEAYLRQALQVVNSGPAQGPTTNYSISDAPTSWDGPFSEIAYQMALRRLRFDSILWTTRLILSVPQDVVNLLDSEISQSESMITTMVEGVKQVKYTSSPTDAYFASVRGFGRGWISADGVGKGRMRGYKLNRAWAAY